jgi:hypothetical protein
MSLPSDPLDTEVSKPGWQRRAVGMSREEAMAHVPRRRIIQTHLTMGTFRALDAYIRTSGQTRSAWLREAIAARLERDGAPRNLIADVRNVHTGPLIKGAKW